MLIYPLLGIALLMGLWWFLPAASRGHIAAHLEVWRGHYDLLICDRSDSPKYKYDELLRERYHILMRGISGCGSDRSVADYMTAHNAVVVVAANQKYGHDVFAECREEVIKSAKARHP